MFENLIIYVEKNNLTVETLLKCRLGRFLLKMNVDISDIAFEVNMQTEKSRHGGLLVKIEWKLSAAKGAGTLSTGGGVGRGRSGGEGSIAIQITYL